MGKIKVLIEGNTPTEMRQDLENFFQSVRDEQNVIVPVSQPVAAAPQPDAEDLDTDDEEQPTLPVVPTRGNHAGFSGVELDSRGLPWDARIHAESRSQNKDGSWRYRRSVEKQAILLVEAELRAGGATQVQPTVTPPVPASPIVGHTPAPVSPASYPTPSAQAVQQPIAPVIPMPTQQPTVLAHTAESFKANLIPTLNELINRGKITPEYMQTLKQFFGVQEIWQINEEQKTQLFDNFVKGGLIQPVMHA